MGIAKDWPVRARPAPPAAPPSNGKTCAPNPASLTGRNARRTGEPSRPGAEPAAPARQIVCTIDADQPTGIDPGSSRRSRRLHLERDKAIEMGPDVTMLHCEDRKSTRLNSSH